MLHSSKLTWKIMPTAVLILASLGISSVVGLAMFSRSRSHVLRVADQDLAKDLTGKIYIVTGANSGVGLETTRQLVKQNAHVIMACRRPEAADEEAKSFSELKGTHDSMKCDLSDLSSVRSFCEDFQKKYDRLDGLVCNAGMVNLSGPKKVTKDGIETTIGISYFGHFLMSELLLDTLEESAPSRMLILSSVVHAGSPKSRPDVALDDLTYEKREFKNLPAYQEAKVACCLYALELADRMKGKGVTTASVHPGWARSNFGSGGSLFMRLLLGASKPITYLVSDSSEEAAQTSLHVMLSDDVVNDSGAYFSQHSVLYNDKQCRPGGWPMTSPNPHARDLAKAKEMVKVSRKIVGLDK